MACLPSGTHWPRQNILAFIRNNWRLSDSPDNAKLVVKKSDVIWIQQKDKVFEEIARLLNVPSAGPDTPGWFVTRMPAIGNIIANMPEAGRVALDKEAAKMAAAGYPAEERMR